MARENELRVRYCSWIEEKSSTIEIDLILEEDF